VDIDRRNSILGNRFVLNNPYAPAARADAIERFRAEYVEDIASNGPMSAATEALAERARKGQHLSACAGRSRATPTSSSLKSSAGSNRTEVRLPKVVLSPRPRPRV
jgi:hypothetical protein